MIAGLPLRISSRAGYKVIVIPGSVVLSAHAKIMMQERMIEEVWIVRAINDPDRTDQKQDNEIHYLKKIPENGGKYLRVIVNPIVAPPRVITVFFDRRVQE